MAEGRQTILSIVEVGVTSTKEQVCQLDFNISRLTRLIPSEGRADENAEREARRHLDGTTGSAPRPNVGVPPSFVRGRDLPKSAGHS
jgi:hypothetical protein